MLPSEVRAAAEMILLLREDHERELSADETRERLFGGMTMEEAEDKACRMICGLAQHILATVPADGDDAITVELLERWGGMRMASESEHVVLPKDAVRFDAPARTVRVWQNGNVWHVDMYVPGYRYFRVAAITSAADLRQLLKLLGCKLEGV